MGTLLGVHPIVPWLKLILFQQDRYINYENHDALSQSDQQWVHLLAHLLEDQMHPAYNTQMNFVLPQFH